MEEAKPMAVLENPCGIDSMQVLRSSNVGQQLVALP